LKGQKVGVSALALQNGGRKKAGRGVKESRGRSEEGREYFVKRSAQQERREKPGG